MQILFQPIDGSGLDCRQAGLVPELDLSPSSTTGYGCSAEKEGKPNKKWNAEFKLK